MSQSHMMTAEGGRSWALRLLSTSTIALLLVAAPIAFNAIALFAELGCSVPSDNDQVFHYLFIERADQAIAAGDNPVDHWLPELELGFPQFHYYQNLPHLTVVMLHHLMLGQLSLLGTLNLTRYLLMVLFPLTVFWSMRRMEFSTIAAAVGAAFSSTLASANAYGFDYHSYVWAGFGMFPQLCSMHLMFIAIACLYRVFERGRGYAPAILASAAIVLTDFIYGYIFALAAGTLCLLFMVRRAAAGGTFREATRRAAGPLLRLGIVAAVAGAIDAYQVVPFLLQFRYVNQTSPELPPHIPSLKHISQLLIAILFGNAGYDRDRLPVVAALVLLGIFYAARTRANVGKTALAFFGSFIFLLVSPIILGPVVRHVPLWRLLPVVRLLGGRDFSAILLAGLGGEMLWTWWPGQRSQLRVAAAAAILTIMLGVALAERWIVYRASADGIRITTEAVAQDADLAQVLATLKLAPQGRVYAGTRGNWGAWMRIGSSRLYDFLPGERFDTVMPWQTLSLNSLYLWNLNLPSLKFCDLFNIHYVIAPPQLRVPNFYQPLLTTERYNLYRIDSGGYLQLGQVAEVVPMPRRLVPRNRRWLASDDPEHGRFVAYRNLDDESAIADLPVIAADPAGDSAPPGTIADEIVTPDSMSARVEVKQTALLVFKVTYHPNWHVMLDGHEQPAFMVSPSFIGTMVPPGAHQVSAVYRTATLKKVLMGLGLATLAAVIGFWALRLEVRLIRGSLSN